MLSWKKILNEPFLACITINLGPLFNQSTMRKEATNPKIQPKWLVLNVQQSSHIDHGDAGVEELDVVDDDRVELEEPFHLEPEPEAHDPDSASLDGQTKSLLKWKSRVFVAERDQAILFLLVSMKFLHW